MKLINTILHNVLNSFNTEKVGYSARKLSGFTGVVVAIYITVFNVKADNSLYFLQSWQVFILICLGLVSAESIIKLFIETKSNGQINSTTGSGETV